MSDLAPSYDRRLDKESERAFEYFLLYRDMMPDARSIRKLMAYEVNNLKPQFTTLARWLTNHDWQERVRDYDYHAAQLRMMKLREQHESEIHEFTQGMFTVARAFQQAVAKKLNYVTQQPPDKMPATELRQLALTYDISSKWLAQLVGIRETNV